MRHASESGRRSDTVIALLIVAVFLLASPLVDWWARPENPWWLPYLLWAGVIALIYLLQRRSCSHDL